MSTPQPLPGGVSSEIAIVEENGRRIVVKELLGQLRVVADWRSNPERSVVEVAALQTAATLLGPRAVPAVLWSDPPRHRFAMELIDASFENWKRRLLDGHIDPAQAAAVGTTLATLHRRSADDPAVRERFDDRTYYDELRLQPFFRRVGVVHPELRPAIDAMIEALLTDRRALVHGDYSPKNLLVRGTDIVVIDWEIAHWGDPRFDVAFALTHLTLKRGRRGASSDAFDAAIDAYLAAYAAAGDPILDAALVRQFATLILARFDGDSPAEYRGDLDASAFRAAAAALLLHAPDDPLAAVARFPRGDAA